jgi:hypothetical protein
VKSAAEVHYQRIAYEIVVLNDNFVLIRKVPISLMLWALSRAFSIYGIMRVERGLQL